MPSFRELGLSEYGATFHQDAERKGVHLGRSHRLQIRMFDYYIV